jgi:pSer/pThr/pTyr-binding forkhead associated (FHA) protein
LAATPIAVLHIEAGAGHGTAYLISDELRSITLGRGADANISLQDVELTRSHARINITPLPRPGGGQRSYELKLFDSGSANGTFVNGMRIRETLLAHGDLIQVGGVRARVFVLAGSGRLS